MKLLQLFAFILFAGSTAWGQVSTCDGVRYTAFSYVPSATTGIQFGNATTIGGNNQDLFVDIYEPTGDVATERPLVIVAFGGSFVSGTRQDMDWMCEYYSSLGYVAATIDYRLYDAPLFPFPDSVDMTEEVLMAVSDMKAAVRFFKEDAATANNYRIDTNHIFVGGISAGAIVASHTALLDSNDVIESYIQPLLANNGGWTGNSSTNTQHTDNVRGLLNFSGALRKSSYIDANDPDLFSVHDDGDETVPYASGSANVFGMPILTMEGSFLMDQQAQSVSVPTELITFPGNGHVSYFQGSAAVADSVLWESATFLYNIICPQYASLEDANTMEDLMIYPNPVAASLNIEWGTYDVVSIEIRNTMGQLIESLKPIGGNATISMDAYDSGMYFVQVNGAQGTRIESIQKL
ncbi:MAG: hypothetical protein Crog4KO_09030 [Crocinitomicaceae bacterium]